jgi:hypothetical protein
MDVAGPRPAYIPSSFDVVTGRPLDVPSNSGFPPSPPVNLTDKGVNYQSFSLLLQPIPTRYELDEMCNLWERDVKIYFDLHVGGPLLTPFLQGDTRGQIRSLHREVMTI